MTEQQLRQKLEMLGAPARRVRLTDNRSVMVSLSRRGVLSVHKGYASAPDRVLKAIVRFVSRGSAGRVRQQARKVILGYQVVTAKVSPHQRARDRALPEDRDVIARLSAAFHALNERHFEGALAEPPIRLSGRMRSRLGHLALDRAGRPVEITISRRHVTVHGWAEVEHTLLHEMVHLWQHASGNKVDHGRVFRAKAREVGAVAAARRWLKRGH